MSVQGRRKAELLEEVRELEERLEHLSAATTEGVFVHEAGRILYLNQTGAEMFGFEPQELLNRDVLELAPPECRPAHLEKIASGWEGAYETLGLRKDGTTFPVELHARNVAVGRKTIRAVTARDLTERREMERELRMTRDVLLRTEELARIGSWSWDPDSGRTTWSPGMYRHYGLTPDEPSLPTEIALRAIHAEDLPRLGKHMHGARESGRLDPIEYRVWVEGAIRHHRTEGEVHRDSKTGSVRMVGFVQDVTALRQMEEERLRAEQERDRLFDISIDLLSVAGFDGQFKQVNPAWTRTLGWTTEELLSRPWRELVHPEDLAATIEAGARLKRGELLTSFENRYRHQDGSYRWLSWNTRALPDDELMFSVTRDVTHEKTAREERRRAEEALRESEEQYRSLFEGAPYGIYRSTPEGRFVTVNRTLATMLGYAPEELLGTTVGELHQDPVEWSRLVAESSNGKPIQGLEAVWTRKDGTAITVRLSGRPLAGEDGLQMGFEMIAEDVTERRLLEERFRQSQKMEAVGRLAGGIAHDFNNLLTAVSGYADLLRVRIPPGDSRRGYVEEIGGAADRAAALTRQLLAFSRRQILQPRVVNLEEIVRNVERMLGRIIGEDIDLETRLAAKGSVRADVSQLEQVLLNLAVNARDAMPEGGKLLIETEDAELLGRDELNHPGRGPMPKGSYVRLAVSDTGMGMDRGALSHIFEPFFTTKEAGKGTGLGLATVYGIVKQSEGFIWASSEPGRGARFEVYLPRVAGEADPPRAAPPSELTGGSETILLVEDEEGVRCVVSEMLEWYGYRVLRATGATEAVALARTHDGPIHLLLTDVVMPRLSGRALRDEVATYRPRTPVLYISGYAGEDRTQELLKNGAAFLAKPFTAAALAQKVREVLTAVAAAEAEGLTPGPV